jgi:hypothetical protein
MVHLRRSTQAWGRSGELSGIGRVGRVVKEFGPSCGRLAGPTEPAHRCQGKRNSCTVLHRPQPVERFCTSCQPPQQWVIVPPGSPANRTFRPPRTGPPPEREVLPTIHPLFFNACLALPSVLINRQSSRTNRLDAGWHFEPRKLLTLSRERSSHNYAEATSNTRHAQDTPHHCRFIACKCGLFGRRQRTRTPKPGYCGNSSSVS